MPPLLREERFLFELPYDARLGPNFANHHKDDRLAPREPEWADFNLQTWFDFDTPPVEGTMRSTTLKFSAASGRTNPMYFAERAFPTFFDLNRARMPTPTRWLDSRPMRWFSTYVWPRGLESRRTVVEAIRIDTSPISNEEDWRLVQMQKALDRLNDFLLAAASIHGDPELAPVALQDLPAVVYGMGWDLEPHLRMPGHIDFWTYVVHDRVPQRPRRPLTRQEADLAMWMTVDADHPLVRPSHLFLSAQQAIHRGRFTHGIVDAGTAVEMMISAAVRLIAPDQGYDQAKLDGVLEAPFASLAKDHFARLLDYSTNPASSDDALGRWWRAGYAIRHEVVHEGIIAYAAKADESLKSALALQADFVDRLRKRGMGDKLPGVPADVKAAADAARRRAGPLY